MKKMIVGLGNPGKEYANNRHNIGFCVLDRFVSFHTQKFNAEFATVDDCVYLKPQTFMNSSGVSVYACAAFYKIEPNDIIIIHDEMDVPFGEVRYKLGGGHAGHRGVKSIVESLGSDKFVRIRCGIGRPAEGTSVIEHVLGNFHDVERQSLQDMISRAVLETTSALSK
jgi:PTH1 family peptidyl-tRNA hydrolase